MALNTGMNEQNRTAVAQGLNRFLADTYALYLKTQHFHWNVSGMEFYSLHILFEKQYTEMAEAIDEIAERIRALGFYVESTFEAFQKISGVPSETKLLTSQEMLRHLLDGHETVIRDGRKLADTAEREHDPATVDLMGRRLGAHEKMAWMLRSSI